MIKAFVFDLDGTLVNTERVHYRAWGQTLKENGVPEVPFETFLTFAGTSNEKVAGDYINSHNIPKSIAELVLEKQALYLELVPEVELCAGALEVISTFKGRVAMAVASSSHRKEVYAILEVFDLVDSFSHIVGGDMVARQKPDPEIYRTANQLLGVPAQHCVAFEDSGHGLHAAKEAGMYGIAVPNEFTRDHDFSRADSVLNSLEEVSDQLLERIVRNGTP